MVALELLKCIENIQNGELGHKILIKLRGSYKKKYCFFTSLIYCHALVSLMKRHQPDLPKTLLTRRKQQEPNKQKM